MKKSSKLVIINRAEIPLDRVRITFSPEINFNQYSFSLNIIRNLKEIEFPTPVTFFVGENGTGESAILEAIASKAGFGAEGGSRNIHFKTSQENRYTGAQNLADQLTLSWRNKPKNGYFFRAESFFNVANYLDQMAREGGGDAALSPQRQLSLLAKFSVSVYYRYSFTTASCISEFHDLFL
jgi:predicted ATPase